MRLGRRSIDDLSREPHVGCGFADLSAARPHGLRAGMPVTLTGRRSTGEMQRELALG
jgi:hypothetical protein